MRTPEAIEKERICKFLRSLPKVWYFRPFMNGYGGVGIPDIVGCCSGAFFSIEVKREGKEPTPAQWRRIHEIEDTGGYAFAGTANIVIPAFKERFGL